MAFFQVPCPDDGGGGAVNDTSDAVDGDGGTVDETSNADADGPNPTTVRGLSLRDDGPPKSDSLGLSLLDDGPPKSDNLGASLGAADAINRLEKMQADVDAYNPARKYADYELAHGNPQPMWTTPGAPYTESTWAETQKWGREHGYIQAIPFTGKDLIYGEGGIGIRDSFSRSFKIELAPGVDLKYSGEEGAIGYLSEPEKSNVYFNETLKFGDKTLFEFRGRVSPESIGQWIKNYLEHSYYDVLKDLGVP